MSKVKKVLDIILIIILITLIIISSINSYVIDSTNSKIIDISATSDKNNYVILVLGASVKKDKPSKMLKDRLDMALDIHNVISGSEVLVTGDSVTDNYDEVSVMTNYLIDNNMDSNLISKDNYGISTYDSIWRAKNIYGYDKIIIVSQKYHLYRALYIAQKLEIDAYGVAAEDIKYNGKEYREFREMLARVKDYFKTMLNSKAKYIY